MSQKSISSSSSVSGLETGSECVPSTAIPPPESKEEKSQVARDEIPTENVSDEKLEPEGDDLQVVPSTRTTSDAANDESSSLNKSDDGPEKPKKSVTIQNSDEVTSTSKQDDHQSSKVLALLKPSPSVHVMESTHQPELSPNRTSNSDNSSGNPLVDEAWENLKKSVVLYKGMPVGTLAALDPSVEALNYNQMSRKSISSSSSETGSECVPSTAIPPPESKEEKSLAEDEIPIQDESSKEIVNCLKKKPRGTKLREEEVVLLAAASHVFVRDFVPSGLAYMMQAKPEVDVVKNFLLKILHLQSAIGRAASVDSGFWWLIMLRSYTKCSQDYALSEMPEMQRGMKLILNLCLSDDFDTFPTLLCADGCSMTDRRKGIYGYPIEIQALFFFALRCARQMLKPERGGKELLERIDKRIIALKYHIQTYFWLDHTQLNNISRYKTEEYSHTAVNKFNVIPDSIPEWVFDFMPLRGGYFIGNVSPACMDFRWFLIGNCIAILSSLATPEQETAIMDLFEERWEDLIGEMPLKIAYPALEGSKWRIVTGCDPKNTSWSYHNGGSWPVLIWLFTAACIKSGRPQIAKKAIELAENRLSKDGWPEYYDGKTGRYIGKLHTGTISGYLVAKQMIENPANVFLISLEEDNQQAEPSVETLNLDVIKNMLEKLVCSVDRKAVFPNLQIVSQAHKMFDGVVKSTSFVDFANQTVWREKGKGENWDSFCFKHGSYLNFKNGISFHSSFSTLNLLCKSIGISHNMIVCGYQDGEVIRFQISERTIKWVSSSPAVQRTKLNDLSYSIVGFVFVSQFEVVFGCMDGCICSMKIPTDSTGKISSSTTDTTDSVSLIHMGFPKEGNMICFDGNEKGWVGLYTEQPSVRVWKGRQITYRGELVTLQNDGLGKISLSGNIVMVCTSREIVSFDMENPEKGIDQKKTAEEEKEFIVATFDSNSEICWVVCRNDYYSKTMMIKHFEVIKKSKTLITDKIVEPRGERFLNHFIPTRPYLGALHEFFGIWVYPGGIFCVPLMTSSQKCLEPRIRNVTSVSLDHKGIVAADGEGTIHLWFFGPEE